MRIPEPADFAALEEWGLVGRPMAAISDYSESKAERRADNERHRRAREAHAERCAETYVGDVQAHYRELDRPIDRTKWDYLKRRKAWYHPPVGWSRFAEPGTARILDLGCGDGDQTQRVAEFVAGRWLQVDHQGFPMEIVGVDLNESRVRNARRHAASPHERITLRFEQADATDGLDYADDFFDYVLVNGLLEALPDDLADVVLDETARLTARGLYVSDILEDYPGLHPRPGLADLLSDHGFVVEQRHELLEEPFREEGTADPLAIWPMNRHQVLYATVAEAVPPSERW